jgi:predicted lipoprotein with Yx(FWY)xxD motif
VGAHWQHAATLRRNAAAAEPDDGLRDDAEPRAADATGQAIYLFDVETTAEPRCYADCAVAWPLVLTTREPVAGQGVDDSLLGTTERRDGSLQVTYDDHPLYVYAHEGTGEVKCHDIFLNGDTWYVVQPDGDAAPPG